MMIRAKELDCLPQSLSFRCANGLVKTKPSLDYYPIGLGILEEGRA